MNAEHIATIRTVIRALADLHNNPDSLAERAAIEAASAERPAYWSTATYHNQVASRFAHIVNEMALADAILQVTADRPEEEIRGKGPRSLEFLLTCLIPLNRQARHEIERARGLR